MNNLDKYKESGVDINAGNQSVNLIKNIVDETFDKHVLTSIGGFGGLYSLGELNYKNPILVSGTDGVGSKLKIAQEMDKHDTIGIDLVAMCVNDIITIGANPLFFLDYIAINKVIPEKIAELVRGIAEGCKQAESSLIGGETAEMPDVYKQNEYDLAGFSVGIVDKEDIIDGSKIKKGDVIIGIKSNGFHSNGYSLLRHVFFKENKMKIDEIIPDINISVGELLLKSTKIYVNVIKEIKKKFKINGIAHITGGGIEENLPRILKDKLKIKYHKWDIPSEFEIVAKLGNITEKESYRVFNMGIGMMLVVNNEIADSVNNHINNSTNDESSIIGEII